MAPLNNWQLTEPHSDPAKNAVASWSRQSTSCCRAASVSPVPPSLAALLAHRSWLSTAALITQQQLTRSHPDKSGFSIRLVCFASDPDCCYKLQCFSREPATSVNDTSLIIQGCEESVFNRELHSNNILSIKLNIFSWLFILTFLQMHICIKLKPFTPSSSNPPSSRHPSP